MTMDRVLLGQVHSTEDVLQVRGGKLAALLMTYPQLIGVDVGAGTGQSSGGTEFYHRSLASTTDR
jgi:hypothetical protein